MICKVSTSAFDSRASSEGASAERQTRAVQHEERHVRQISCGRDWHEATERRSLTDIVPVSCDSLLREIGRPDDDLEPERTRDGEKRLAEATKAEDAERLAPGHVE